MKKGTGKYWIGKGTLGDIKQNEEIPLDYITPKRMQKFIDDGLVGDLIKPFDKDANNILRARITELEAQVKEFDQDEIDFLKEQVKELEAQVEKLENELKKAKSK